jgi:hypothetical protein
VFIIHFRIHPRYFLNIKKYHAEAFCPCIKTRSHFVCCCMISVNCSLSDRVLAETMRLLNITICCSFSCNQLKKLKCPMEVRRLTDLCLFLIRLRHILGYCDVALGKTESSFNRIAWRHDKVLQTARAKALERSKLIKTKGYQLMADLDKNRHDFLQTLRSFDSKLKQYFLLLMS